MVSNMGRVHDEGRIALAFPVDVSQRIDDPSNSMTSNLRPVFEFR